MREFLRAFWSSWLAFMSGICSVLFWLAVALMEYLDRSVAARIGFYFAGIASSILASYFVWKKTDESAKQRIAGLDSGIMERESTIAKLRADLSATVLSAIIS
jgi:hypothetical protein